MSKYIVSVDQGTPEQESLFVKLISKYGYWHWVSGTWLINANISIEEMTEIVRTNFVGKNFIINRIDTGTWRGFGPKSEEPNGANMFKWINKNWSN